jgi:hypothetical protein
VSDDVTESDTELEIADDADALPMVAASESEMIMMARALVAPRGHDTWAYLAGSRAMPDKIGPTCEDLIADALSHVWPALWRRDGARPRASLAGGRVVRGRPWQRHPTTPLAFTGATLSLLRWLVGTPLATGGEVPELSAKPLAIGDEVAIYLALDIAAESAPQRVIARQPMVRRSALAWLGFAHLMQGEPPDFAPLVTGAGAIVVDALNRELADRWRAAEQTKRGLDNPDELLAFGRAQTDTLDRFMTACETAGRRDLAGFVLDAARLLLERSLSPAPQLLDPSKPLSTRSAARLAAGGLLRGVRRWAHWDEQHRGVRFIDDDYDAAQLLLARFEPIGRTGTDVAAQLLSDLASLAPTASPNSTTIEAP